MYANRLQIYNRIARKLRQNSSLSLIVNNGLQMVNYLAGYCLYLLANKYLLHVYSSIYHIYSLSTCNIGYIKPTPLYAEYAILLNRINALRLKYGVLHFGQ